MKFKNYIIYLCLTLSTSCAEKYSITSYTHEQIEVKTNIDSTIYKIITPYQNGIAKEMNEVITYNKFNLEKGKPQSTIGNFVTDLCLKYADANICIMNSGGLRTSISKGQVTKGQIFELMPFENELVIINLNKKEYINLLDYIAKRGGEPFSGLNIEMNSDGEIIKNSWPVNFNNGEKLKVLTSDYLANGGDNMSFFIGKKQQKIGIKLRDAIIDHCKNSDTISVKIDDRIKIINTIGK